MSFLEPTDKAGLPTFYNLSVRQYVADTDRNTMEIGLHFCQFARAITINSTNAYVDGVNQRLLPAFEGIEEEADKATEAAWQNILAADGSNHDSDPGDWADYANERGLEVYENLCFVRQKLLGLAAAGLYHLWERLIKQFIPKELRHWSLPEQTFLHIERADFAAIKEALSQFGLSIEGLDYHHALNELRLVANVVKHGDGASCRELSSSSPGLFRGTDYKLDISSVADTLELKPEDFSKYANAVLEFWNTFPDQLALKDDVTSGA